MCLCCACRPDPSQPLEPCSRASHSCTHGAVEEREMLVHEPVHSISSPAHSSQIETDQKLAVMPMREKTPATSQPTSWALKLMFPAEKSGTGSMGSLTGIGQPAEVTFALIGEGTCGWKDERGSRVDACGPRTRRQGRDRLWGAEFG